VTLRSAGMPDLVLQAGVRVAAHCSKHTKGTGAEEEEGDLGPRYAFLDAGAAVGCDGGPEVSHEAVAVCARKRTVGVAAESSLFGGGDGGGDGDSPAAAWFSALLGVPAALLRAADVPNREAPAASTAPPPNYSALLTSASASQTPLSPSSSLVPALPSVPLEAAQPPSVSSSFSNEAPFLLISSRSVALLNQAMKRALLQRKHAPYKNHPCGVANEGSDTGAVKANTEREREEEDEAEVELVTARNFRPNFVAGGNDGGLAAPHDVDAHVEDRWASLAIGRYADVKGAQSEGVEAASAAVVCGGTGNSERGWQGVQFTAIGDCARCAMVDVHYPANMAEADGANGANGRGKSVSAEAEVAGLRRTSALRTLASYRRRHAQIVFGRYLAAAPPPGAASSDSADTGPPHTGKVLLQWIAEGDAIEPLSYCGLV
jgi:hypothetical protein